MISVDIWDTALSRVCHPDEVKLSVARALFLAAYPDLLPEFRSPRAVLEARQKCEGRIGTASRASGFDDEYRIGDVWARCLSTILNSPLEPGEAETWVAKLIRTELAEEARACRPDTGLETSKWFRCGLPVVGISDFYVPRDLFEPFLRRVLPHFELSDLYVSCDAYLNKRSGRLFEYIHRRADVKPRHHVHIGDSVEADVEGAARAGVRGIRFRNRWIEARRRRNEKKWRERGEQVDGYVSELLARLRHEVNPPAGLATLERELYSLGRDSALIYCGLVAKAFEEAQKRRLERVYYFTREGELLAELHTRLAKWLVGLNSSPRPELLEVSRVATLGPSLREVSAAELMRIWNLYSTQSMKGLFASLNVPLPEVLPFLEERSIDSEAPIRYPWRDERVLSLLADPKLQATVENHRQLHRELLTRYLRQKELDARDQAIIVDIGWRGTIQDNLCHLLPATEFIGVYLGLFRFLNAQPDNGEKLCFGPDERSDSSEVASIIKFVSPLEMLANSPNGTVTGYVAGPSGVEAVRSADEGENMVHTRFVRHFQAGVIAAADPIGLWMRTHAFSADELRGVCIQQLSRLALNPPRVLAQGYFSLSHNEVFGLGRFVAKSTRFPIKLALKGVLSKNGAKEFLSYLEETGWPQGYLNLYWLRPLRRLYNYHVRRSSG